MNSPTLTVSLTKKFTLTAGVVRGGWIYSRWELHEP